MQHKFTKEDLRVDLDSVIEIEASEGWELISVLREPGRPESMVLSSEAPHYKLFWKRNNPPDTAA